MKIEATENEIKNEQNKIWLEEDEMELQVNFIEKRDNIYVLNNRAIIDGEAYNNFEVEVQLLEDLDIKSVSDILNAEWDWYDFLI